MTDFDALAVEAADGRNKLGERAYAQAALQLDVWYFIGVSPEDAPDQPEPMVVAGVGGHRLLVFTDEARAEGYCDHLIAKGKPNVVLHMGVRDAVAYCDMLREHNVAAAHFNDGSSSASIPLARIVEMASG